MQASQVYQPQIDDGSFTYPYLTKHRHSGANITQEKAMLVFSVVIDLIDSFLAD